MPTPYVHPLEKMVAELREGLPAAERAAEWMLSVGGLGHTSAGTAVQRLRAMELMQGFLAAAVKCLSYIEDEEGEAGKILNVALGLAFFYDTSEEERADIAKRLESERGQ